MGGQFHPGVDGCDISFKVWIGKLQPFIGQWGSVYEGLQWVCSFAWTCEERKWGHVHTSRRIPSVEVVDFQSVFEYNQLELSCGCVR